MSVCRAIRVGLVTALIAMAWIGERVDGCAAQTSLAQPAKAPPRKQSAGGDKGVTISESRYTAGLVTGMPQSTEFAIAQEIATTLAAGQETGPHGEMALRVLPIVGNGGVRNVIIGALLVGTLFNGMTILDMSFTAQNVVKSLILLVAIVVDSVANPRDEQTAQQGDI